MIFLEGRRTRMEKSMVKPDLDHSKLEDLGYTESMMEGGYVSKDGATIVYTARRPYIGEVVQYRAKVETKHMQNVDQLRKLGLLKE
jgi:hypothetical protein